MGWQGAIPELGVPGEQQEQVPDETGDKGMIRAKAEGGRQHALERDHRPCKDTRTNRQSLQMGRHRVRSEDGLRGTWEDIEKDLGQVRRGKN